jgi:hypothetical protein
MIAFTRLVTYAWPSLTRAGGCSLTRPLGTTQETAGNRLLLAEARNRETGWMLPSCPSWRTVAK